MKEVLTATKFIDGFCYKNSFVLLIVSTVINDLLPIGILGPQILRAAIFIVFNDVIGSLENGFG